jgi:hypothetical protein
VVTWRGPDPCFVCAPEPGQAHEQRQAAGG